MARKKKIEIDINPAFERALSLIEDRHSIFITGRAGTGKSTLLNYFRTRTKRKMAVLAPTGIAALNVGGQTIHSFFGFKPDITLKKVRKFRPGDEREAVLKKIEMIVIDEVSMVRADLLDCADKMLRLYRRKDQPFGGLQIVMIGDLYQLPPVVNSLEKDVLAEHYESPYFFSAKVFADGFHPDFVELDKVYRQKDEDFISVLNAVRNNSAGEAELSILNKRLDPGFEPDDEPYITLTSTNAAADEVNLRELALLPEDELVSKGRLSGSFDTKSLPNPETLRFKSGAQVMLLVNDSLGEYFNGSLATIIGVETDEETGVLGVRLELADGGETVVYKHTWEMFAYKVGEDGAIESEKTGTYTQYPFKLAWAITIHKSQGQTFDRVILDLGRGTFAHGQLYVALSRCRTLEGLKLRQTLRKGHILMDWRVVRFVTAYQYAAADQVLSLADKRALVKQAIAGKERCFITYLKASDVKSQRVIRPLRLGDCEYMGKTFEGLRAFDEQSGEERTFRLDRVLEMAKPDESDEKPPLTNKATRAKKAR